MRNSPAPCAFAKYRPCSGGEVSLVWGFGDEEEWKWSWRYHLTSNSPVKKVQQLSAVSPHLIPLRPNLATREENEAKLIAGSTPFPSVQKTRMASGFTIFDSGDLVWNFFFFLHEISTCYLLYDVSPHAVGLSPWLPQTSADWTGQNLAGLLINVFRLLLVLKE